jgi:4-hydroxybenzoate polyprenyltransferase
MVVERRASGAPRWIGALLRASHPEPSALVTLIAVVLAARTGRSALGVIEVGAAVAAGQLSVGWHNDWLDVNRDIAAGRRDKPLATGEISTGAVRRAALIALAVTVPLSLASGAPAAGAHLAAVLLAWAYNARLKATAASFVPFAVSFALLVAFITLGADPSSWPSWWALGAASLLGCAAHLVNAAPDLADDLVAGVRGLPHRLGRTTSVRASLCLLVAASALVSFGPGRPGWGAGVALGAVVVAMAVGLVLGARPGSRWLFRSVLLVAAIDVVELVVRGGHL